MSINKYGAMMYDCINSSNKTNKMEMKDGDKEFFSHYSSPHDSIGE